MSVSVIIPSYNAQDTIEKALNSIDGQDFDFEIETIVIDCSDTKDVEDICLKYKSVKYHYEEKRFNPGIGRNIGANIASGDLLFFVDSDVNLDETTISNAWEYYQKGHMIFGGVIELDTDVDHSVSSYVEFMFFNHECQRNRPECIRRNLSSAMMFIDRNIFLEEGGFKNIPRMQDTEFTERLVSKGYELTFTPTIVALQIQNSAIGKVLKKIYINGRNIYYIRYRLMNTAKKSIFFILLPVLSSLKVIRIIVRHLLYSSSKDRIITIFLAPLILLCGYVWMFGIYHAMIFGGGISQNRE